MTSVLRHSVKMFHLLRCQFWAPRFDLALAVRNPGTVELIRLLDPEINIIRNLFSCNFIRKLVSHFRVF